MTLQNAIADIQADRKGNTLQCLSIAQICHCGGQGMPRIFAKHWTGFRIELDDVDRDKLNAAIDWLIEHDFRPDGSGDEWPKTPGGLPLCTKHNVEMRQRQKQGDSWFSHKIIDPASGEERFCKGFRNPSNPSDGFDL